MSKHDNKITGSSGEKKAVQYLKSNGFIILETNFSTDIGEIDIIAASGDTLVFIEVKTRKTIAFGFPSEAVDYRKQNKISMVASQYIKKRMMYGVKIRFDVIEIILDEIKINHYENAFNSYLKY